MACLLVAAAPAPDSSLEIAPPPLRHAHQRDPAPIPPGLACPGDVVVWVNTRTRIYRREGAKWFGRTIFGHYLCQKAAQSEGDRETLSGD